MVLFVMDGRIKSKFANSIIQKTIRLDNIINSATSGIVDLFKRRGWHQAQYNPFNLKLICGY